jgi:hypothetical protein
MKNFSEQIDSSLIAYKEIEKATDRVKSEVKEVVEKPEKK